MENTLISWYQTQTATGQLNFDEAQQILVAELSQFLNNFARQNFITRLFKRNDKLGYYIYGDVGRGKSMIMNAMYQHTTTKRKNRWHFHEFMREIHQQLALMTNIDDPLVVIANDLRQDYDIIYLDEMHVSDIATAMIMKKLLDAVFAKGIYIVTSSNYHPDKLWPNGLMRERFFPAIETLKSRLNVVSLNSQQDYRLINNSFNKLFIQASTASYQQLQQIFSAINLDNNIEDDGEIEISSRMIPYIRRGGDVIWFDFAIICGDMRSQLDYLELVSLFKWFIISDIPTLGSDKKDIARRFTWLIDILYDHNAKLAISSIVSIREIYTDGDFSNEFERTVSRLEEMQTEEYLQKNLTPQ